MMMTTHTASAPAKVILFGEHFVVYGNPAILAAINSRITATVRAIQEDRIVIKSDIGAAGEYSGSTFKLIDGGGQARIILDPLCNAVKQVLAANRQKTGVRIDLRSEVPYGVGLGSSAASCVATVAVVDSLSSKHDRQWICKKAVESERMIHKNSSGADCYVSTVGGLIRYSKKDGYKRLESKDGLSIVIGNTGTRHSTGALVERVAKFKDKNKSKFRDLSRQASQICSDAVSAIESGSQEKLGMLMNENQKLLREVGVSQQKAETLIETCINAGALGAKITGAGGGGAIIALAATKKESARIAASVRKSGFESIEAEIDHTGLII